jgi:hypothetical protein
LDKVFAYCLSFLTYTQGADPAKAVYPMVGIENIDVRITPFSNQLPFIMTNSFPVGTAASLLSIVSQIRAQNRYIRSLSFDMMMQPSCRNPCPMPWKTTNCRLSLLISPLHTIAVQ